MVVLILSDMALLERIGSKILYQLRWWVSEGKV